MQLKNFEQFINEDWGSSDQAAMNQSMHKDLGSPKKFPGLDPILQAAEDAVDFYWEDWPEYKKDREELINKAGRAYMRAYFPDLFAGFTAMFSESVDDSDETFESFLLLAEAWRLEPEPKDDMRISDIVKKSAGNENKEISLAQQMAKSIKDGDKAIRRARAAFAKGLEHIAKPFYLKAKDLGYDYQLSDAELKLTESIDEAMVQVAGKDKPSGAQVLATVIVDYMMEQDYLKPGADKVRKHLIDDLKKLIMDSTF